MTQSPRCCCCRNADYEQGTEPFPMGMFPQGFNETTQTQIEYAGWCERARYQFTPSSNTLCRAALAAAAVAGVAATYGLYRMYTTYTGTTDHIESLYDSLVQSIPSGTIDFTSIKDLFTDTVGTWFSFR